MADIRSAAGEGSEPRVPNRNQAAQDVANLISQSSAQSDAQGKSFWRRRRRKSATSPFSTPETTPETEPVSGITEEAITQEPGTALADNPVSVQQPADAVAGELVGARAGDEARPSRQAVGVVYEPEDSTDGFPREYGNIIVGLPKDNPSYGGPAEEADTAAESTANAVDETTAALTAASEQNAEPEGAGAEETPAPVEEQTSDAKSEAKPVAADEDSEPGDVGAEKVVAAGENAGSANRADEGPETAEEQESGQVYNERNAGEQPESRSTDRAGEKGAAEQAGGEHMSKNSADKTGQAQEGTPDPEDAERGDETAAAAQVEADSGDTERAAAREHAEGDSADQAGDATAAVGQHSGADSDDAELTGGESALDDSADQAGEAQVDGAQQAGAEGEEGSAAVDQQEGESAGADVAENSSVKGVSDGAEAGAAVAAEGGSAETETGGAEADVAVTADGESGEGAPGDGRSERDEAGEGTSAGAEAGGADADVAVTADGEAGEGASGRAEARGVEAAGVVADGESGEGASGDGRAEGDEAGDGGAEQGGSEEPGAAGSSGGGAAGAGGGGGDGGGEHGGEGASSWAGDGGADDGDGGEQDADDEDDAAELTAAELAEQLAAEQAAMALITALMKLRGVLAAAQLPLEVVGADEARHQQKEMVDQLDDYLLPRLVQLEAPILTVVGGSTGAGKSTLVNTVIGKVVSEPGVLRPTTRSPVLIHHPADGDWFVGDRVLPGMARTSSEAPGGTEDPGQLRLVASDTVPRGLAILDAPDIDSVVEANRDLATQLLGAADLWLFVTTAARYSDAVPWDFLQSASDRSTSVAVVLDRAPGETIDDITGHLAQLLLERGLGESPLFSIQETVVDSNGMLPHEAVASIKDWLIDLAADAEARAGVVRRTLTGAVSAMVKETPTFAAAVQAQADTATQLRSTVETVYDEAVKDIAMAAADGTLLRGEVLARWQEFVGTGELLKGLQSNAGRLRDRLKDSLGEKPAETRDVSDAIESGLESLLREYATSAAEAAEKAWQATAAGRQLLVAGGPELGAVSEEFPAAAIHAVDEWQAYVLSLVRQEGADKRSAARIMEYGVTGLGLSLMIVTFASAAGIPKNASTSVGIGSAVVGQRLLEAVFGAAAVRSLVEKARDDLDGKVHALMDAEFARYLAVLEQHQVDPETAGQLTDAARAVEDCT